MRRAALFQYLAQSMSLGGMAYRLYRNPAAMRPSQAGSPMRPADLGLSPAERLEPISH